MELLVLAIGMPASTTVTMTPIQNATADQPYDPIYEDDSYKFTARGYGHKGQQIPGMFVFSKHKKSWMQISEISTKGAKLGRSPDFKDGQCAVGWDYSSFKTASSAPIPLLTSGSISFPTEIVFDSEKQLYALHFNSDWKLDYVTSIFYIHKPDLDRAFK